MTLSTKYRIAIHEAGHAVVAWALDYPCTFLTIIQDEDAAGFAETSACYSGYWENLQTIREAKTRARHEIIITLGGRCAEECFLGGADDFGCSNDDAYVEQVIFKNSLAADRMDRDEVKEQLRRRCELLVLRHFKKIERLAALLLKQGSLAQPSIDASIRGRDRAREVLAASG